jgi:hypothetical protein
MDLPAGIVVAIAFSFRTSTFAQGLQRILFDTVQGCSGNAYFGLLMELQHRRRLIFMKSEKWSGWFCERCCWSRVLPESAAGRDVLAAAVGAEFNTHDCEMFAQHNWANLIATLKRNSDDEA